MVLHFLGFILRPFSLNIKIQLKLIQTPECIVCFMLMNVKVLVVQCGSITFIAIIRIQDIFNKKYLHEALLVEGYSWDGDGICV